MRKEEEKKEGEREKGEGKEAKVEKKILIAVL